MTTPKIINPRLPLTLSGHTGSPVGYSEVCALLFRSLLEIGVETHYQSLAEDYIYEAKSYDMIVNDMRQIEPERNMPWITFSTAPLFWCNGGNYRIGWTMMEVDKLNPRWVRACNSMHEVWVPTKMQVNVFRDSGVTVPIYEIPLAIDTTRYMPSFLPMIYHGEHDFRFFSMAWWQLRKRWDLLTIGFAEEFGKEKNVGLLMKTMTAQNEGEAADQIQSWIGHRCDDQIALIEGAFPWWEVVMMMRSAHAFVLPTAGEGYGCPPVQALACGLPVIVTDCMGPGEVLRMADGNPYPGVRFVKCEKAPTGVMHEYYEGSNWWVADSEDLRKAMREVYENYPHWKEQAMIGSELIRRDKSGTVMALKVKERIAEIYGKENF